MALFSRRKKSEPADEPVAAGATTPAESPADASVADEQAPVEETPGEAVPDVSISVSTFRGAASVAQANPEASDGEKAAAAALPQGARQVPLETVPGLRDNVLLREALAAMPDKPTSQDALKAARQVLQGHLFLRVKGDARAMLAEGKDLPLGVVRRGDDQFVLAYSSGAALQAAMKQDQQTDTSAVGQPSHAVIAHVLRGDNAGLIIDHASAPHTVVLSRDLLERMLRDGDASLTLKNQLAERRDASTPAKIADTMTQVKLFVAVREAETVEGDGPRRGIAEVREPDGTRLIQVFSHPLEVVALGRGDQALPFSAAQLGKALRDHPEIGGVIIDAVGPWLKLNRDELAPVIAKADEVPPAPDEPTA